MRSFFWSVFSRIRTELSLRIQSECGKYGQEKNSVFRHFSLSCIVPGIKIVKGLTYLLGSMVIF